MKVGIAGVGGIGSNVAVHLVRTGVKHLKLVDFDRVELSNLNRQFYFHDQIGSFKVDALEHNLLRIAPDLAIEKAILKLDAGNMVTAFGECDAVVEGFDEKVTKKLLLENLAAVIKLLVSASGVAGTDLFTVEVRHMNACTIIGDFHTDAAEVNCHSPKVAIVAAMMADVLLSNGGYYEQ